MGSGSSSDRVINHWSFGNISQLITQKSVVPEWTQLTGGGPAPASPGSPSSARPCGDTGDAGFDERGRRSSEEAQKARYTSRGSAGQTAGHRSQSPQRRTEDDVPDGEGREKRSCLQGAHGVLQGLQRPSQQQVTATWETATFGDQSPSVGAPALLSISSHANQHCAATPTANSRQYGYDQTHPPC